MVTDSKPKHFTMKAPQFLLTMLIACTALLAGCRKDIPKDAAGSSLATKAARSHSQVHERPLKASMDVYHIYTPDSLNGGCYCAPYLPGYMAGEGEGHSTLLGTFYTYSNLYAYYSAAGPQVTYSVPLTDAYYDRLTTWFTPGEVAAIRAGGVEVIFFDRQGNALWSEIDPLHMDPAPANPLHFSLTGRGKITGGTGKFAGATGFYDFTGYSDVYRNSAPGIFYQLSRMDLEGTIVY